MHLLGYDLGPKSYPMFIAEISCNHCGDFENIFKLMDRAKASFADAVKIQVYTPEEMTIDSKKDDFQIKKGLWKGKNLFELYQATHTHPDMVQPVFDYAKHIRLPVFASVFGLRSLEVLERYNCQAYKIASFEFNHTELVEAVLSTRKPVIMSTGMATDAEVSQMSDKIKRDIRYNPDFMFMHCVSKYPTKYEDASLFRIRRFAEIYGSQHTGYSDHTKGSLAPILAAALGAKVIEKHFYDPKLGESEDKAFSMSPKSFRLMVTKVRDAYNACLEKAPRGIEPAFQFKRSIYSTTNIKRGAIFSEKNIGIIRPSYGLDPSLFKNVIKSHAKYDIEAGTPLKGDMIEWK